MDFEARIFGLTALLEKERTFGAKVEGPLAEALRDVGEDVAVDVRRRYEEYSPRGADGVRPKVLTSGLWVVQTLRKSRNPKRQRKNFGALMMREAFIPAVDDNETHLAEAAALAVEEAKARYWDT